MTGVSCATRSHGAAAIVVVLAWLQSGCATPQDRIDAFATAHGWTTGILAGTDFRHVVIFNGVRGDRLHVYIEGDGSPYLDRWTVAPDPTPRRPVMLGLMALDAAPSVYVGRPCYLGLARDPPCTPADWTVDRYSERVTASTARVIEHLRSEHRAASIEIYGHSGGGTLAVLIAHRMQGVGRIVTLAGNLDTDAWTRYHGYAPLRGSLNPVRLGRLPDSILQQHLAGGADRTVPAWLVLDAAPVLGSGEADVLAGVTHTTGWKEHWAAILEPTAAPLTPRTDEAP